MLKWTIKIVVVLTFVLVFFLGLAFLPQNLGSQKLAKEKRSAEKGLYVTYYIAKSPRTFNHIKFQAKKSGLNTIIIDAKFALEKPLLALAKEKKLQKNTPVTPDPWLTKVTKELHNEGFIVSARIVVFKDDHLVIARPDLAIKIQGKNPGSGGLYRDHKMGRWADPYSAEVRLYNTLISERAALSGVDEVQFDYIRFPAERGSHLAYFPFKKEGMSRVEAITTFLKEVRSRLKKYNTSIAMDIFGVTAWQSPNDIESLGQDLKAVAPYIDVLCPMLYPSHFHSGYDGFANPGSEPYYFLAVGVKKIKEILSNEAVAIIPWIQGFNLRSPNYGPWYIKEQIRACEDEGADGYLIWNARNDYSTSFQALKNK